MPSIKVYKDGKTLIPINRAKTAKAYICPWTDKLFPTKRGYVSHLINLRATRMHSRARVIIKQNKMDDFLGQPTINGLVNWVKINPDFFFNRSQGPWYQNESTKKRLNSIRDEFWIKITNIDLTYSDSVSNSHSSPFSGVSNWGGRVIMDDGTPAPTGYPGFAGRIEFSMSHDIGRGSDAFSGTGLNTGSGGGGRGINDTCNYSFELSMYLDDFPNIKAAIDQEKVAFDKANLLQLIKNEHMLKFKKSYSCRF